MGGDDTHAGTVHFRLLSISIKYVSFLPTCTLYSMSLKHFISTEIRNKVSETLQNKGFTEHSRPFWSHLSVKWYHLPGNIQAPFLHITPAGRSDTGLSTLSLRCNSTPCLC